MTIPAERTMAVQHTERFLIALTTGHYKRVPREVREAANRLLRHYPNAFDLTQSADELPDIWGRPK